jgi:hypothetical protein
MPPANITAHQLGPDIRMFVESRLDGVAEPVVQQHCYEAYNNTISNTWLHKYAALEVGKLYRLANRHVNDKLRRRV